MWLVFVRARVCVPAGCVDMGVFFCVRARGGRVAVLVELYAMRASALGDRSRALMRRFDTWGRTDPQARREAPTAGYGRRCASGDAGHSEVTRLADKRPTSNAARARPRARAPNPTHTPAPRARGPAAYAMPLYVLIS